MQFTFIIIFLMLLFLVFSNGINNHLKYNVVIKRRYIINDDGSLTTQIVVNVNDFPTHIMINLSRIYYNVINSLM